LPQQTKLFLKNFPTLQKIKTHQQTPQTMTQKLNIDKGYSDTVDRRPAGNSTYKKLAVQWLIEALCFVSSCIPRLKTSFLIFFFRQHTG
jgi:hypothetical protein